MGYGICPNCDEKIVFKKEPEIGIQVLCGTCQIEFVVTWLNPIELDIIDFEEIPTDDVFDNYDDFENYDIPEEFVDDADVETFQKIWKNKRGGNHGNGKVQEK